MTPDSMSDSVNQPFIPSAAARPAGQSGGWVGFGRFLRREPLLHFCVLGGLIFAADAALHPKKADEKEIVVTKERLQAFRDGFDEDQQRTPSDAELRAMTDAWVASEILYREGKAMGVDRGDDMIRDRIAYKLQLMVFDQVKVPDPTPAQLGDWFAKHHERWDLPETVSFLMTTPVDEATARQQFEDIKAGRESDELKDRTRAIVGRPVAALAPSLGAGFRDALLGTPVGEWRLMQSKDGWHVVRLEEHRPGAAAKLEDVTEAVTKAYRTDETRRLAWEAVTRLKSLYKVRYE